MASEMTRASTLYHGFIELDELLESEVREELSAGWRVPGSYAVVVVLDREWLWEWFPFSGAGAENVWPVCVVFCCVCLPSNGVRSLGTSTC